MNYKKLIVGPRMMKKCSGEESSFDPRQFEVVNVLVFRVKTVLSRRSSRHILSLPKNVVILLILSGLF